MRRQNGQKVAKTNSEKKINENSDLDLLLFCLFPSFWVVHIVDQRLN